MQERARQRELRNAGVVAAREARQKLAQAVALLDRDGADPASAKLAGELSSAVGALFGCEIGGPADVLEKLRVASGVLSGVLARVHGPAAGSTFDRAGELVAASLAVLYPVRAGLERDLAPSSPPPSRKSAPRAFTVRGSAVQVRETVAEQLSPEDQAELDAVRVLASQAKPTVLDLEPPVHVEVPVDVPVDVAADLPVEIEEDASGTEAARPRPISVRPLPLGVEGPPASVQTLLSLAGDAEEPAARTSLEAQALFPEAAEEVPMLLLDRRSGRRRRRALELVPDAAGHLVDAVSGERHNPVGAERRDRERAELEVDIGLHSASQFYAGLSNDISAGGIFVSTIKPLPVGSELTVSFVLPGGHSVTTRGRVAWLSTPRDEDSRPGMGVRFEELEPEHRAAIDKFLRYRPPMFHEL